VAEEIVYLQTDCNWGKDKLPSAGDQAIRAVIAAWKLGVSVKAVSTFSKLKGINSKINNLGQEAAIAKAKKKAEAKAGNEGDNSSTNTPNVPEGLPTEAAMLLAELTTDFAAWYAKDSKSAMNSLNAYRSKVGKAAGSAVTAAATAAVNG
jgi:hypothetical protein